MLPMLIAVAAPARLTVLAVVLIKLKVGWLVVMSPPLTNKSCSNVAEPSTTILLLMLVVPVVEPISTKVAAPPKYKFSTVVLAR